MPITGPQRFCTACGRWLNDPVWERRALPAPPPTRWPPLACHRCGYPGYPTSTCCANCGARLLPAAPPPRPPKKERNWPWLPYVMFPLMVVLQVGLLVVLFVTAHGHYSAARLVFIGAIALHGVANIIAGINLVQMFYAQKLRERRNRQL